MENKPWGSWGCPHESKGWCRRLRTECAPGQKGCVIKPELMLGTRVPKNPPAATRRLSTRLTLICSLVPATEGAPPDVPPGWYALLEPANPHCWLDEAGLSRQARLIVGAAVDRRTFGVLEPPGASACRIVRRLKGLPAAQYVRSGPLLSCGCPAHGVRLPTPPPYLDRLEEIIRHLTPIPSKPQYVTS